MVNARNRPEITLQPFTEAGQGLANPALTTQRWATKVAFQQEDLLLSSLSKRDGQVCRDGTFALLRDRTRDQHRLQRTGLAQLSQTDTQKAKLLRAQARLVHQAHQPAIRRWRNRQPPEL